MWVFVHQSVCFGLWNEVIAYLQIYKRLLRGIHHNISEFFILSAMSRERTIHQALLALRK